jgi:Flp pilus assembly protein TadD
MAHYEEALKAAEMAVGINPASPQAYNILGFALVGVDRFEEAQGAFEESIRLDPDFADPHYGLGVAALLSGDTRTAQKQKEILQGINPRMADQLDNLIQQGE